MASTPSDSNPENPTPDNPAIPPAAAIERLVGFLGHGIVLLVAVFLIGSCALGPGPKTWLKNTLIGFVNDRLEPTLAIDEFDRLGSGQWVMRRLRLTQDETPVVEIHRVALDIAAIRSGGEIKIDRLQLDRPIIRLYQTQDGFLGLAPLLTKRSDREQQEPKSTDPTKPSETIELKRIDIRKGRVILDLLQAEPMEFDEIDLVTNFDPGATDRDGWNDLSFQIGRGRGLTGTFEGRINIDSALLQIINASLTIDISPPPDPDLVPSPRDQLPQLLKSLVEEHNLKGTLRIDLRGDIPLLEPTNAQVIADITGTDISYATDGVAARIDQAVAKVRYNAGTIEIDRLLAAVGDGSVRGTATYVLTQPAPPDSDSESTEAIQQPTLATRLNITNLQLSDVLTTDAVRGTLNATADVNYAPSAPDGTVRLTIEKGDLIALPVITQIANIVGKTPLPKLQRRHSAELTATLAPEGITLSETAFSTNVVAGDVTGTIGYDGSLKLKVKAGPLKRTANALGWFGKPIDMLLEISRSYRVGGTLAQPKVSLRDIKEDKPKDKNKQPETDPEAETEG